MKIVHFAKNITNGAGRAAYRLHKALLEEGTESLMLVNYKTDFDDTVIQLTGTDSTNKGRFYKLPGNFLNRAFDLLPFYIQKERWRLRECSWQPLTLFNMNIAFVSMRRLERHLESVDVICLHSIESVLSSGLIKQIHTLTRAPIVWTLMDIEPITGGCHFNNGCDRFVDNCGNCPQLSKRMENDISRRIWRQKIRDYRNIPITLVAVTSNSHEQISQSSLFKKNRIEKIFLSASKSMLKKVKKNIAREALGLPKEKKMVLFGCFSLDDKRKGGDYLLEALMRLPYDSNLNGMKLADSVVLVTMGRKGNFDASELPLEWIHLGGVKDDRMVSLVFQASDVFACPSVDDVGPMMINEAFMCGTQVVAFDSGVAPDLIVSEDAGYVAKHGDVSDFSAGLLKSFSETRGGEVSEDIARLRNFCTPKAQGNKYLSLFNSLLTAHKD